MDNTQPNVFEGDLSVFDIENVKWDLNRCIDTAGSNYRDLYDVWWFNAKAIYEHKIVLHNKIEIMS